jgi:hypothetical protein
MRCLCLAPILFLGLSNLGLPVVLAHSRFGKRFKPKYESAGPACNRIGSQMFVSSQVIC